MLSKIQGKTAEEVAKRLGVGEIGGVFAEIDDRNPVWVDEEFDSTEEGLAEKLATDDALNGWKIKQTSKAEALILARQAQRELRTHFSEIAFREWQSFWRAHVKKFEEKMESLERQAPTVTPYDFFSAEEKAIFRNMSS
jgi:hypothetical protein